MGFIETLNIVQHSHQDIGYTDLPSITGIIHQRIFAEAVERMKSTRDLPDGERFCWTAETSLPVLAWWRSASSRDRDTLIGLAASGQFDVGAMAVHQNGHMNEQEWDWCLNFLPRDLRQALNVRTLIQIDVNGLPLGGAVRASESGINQAWMGPNNYMGFQLVPFSQLFYWRLPNGKKLLVWQNDKYNNWEQLIFSKDWRKGPIPSWSDLQFRPPEAADRYEPSEENIRSCHSFLLSKLADFEKSCAGHYREIPVSCTNSYRIDNDPPTPGLPQFVHCWNELGLKPQLKLTTFSRAIQRAAASVTDIPEYSGSWPDWWANGMTSMPRQCMASRQAKRIYSQLECPVFNGCASADAPLRRQALHDLVIFDEHCYCSWSSVSRPWSPLTEGAAAEKTEYAWRAKAKLELLRADLLREIVSREVAYNTVSLANLNPIGLSEYVPLRTEALRGEYNAVMDESSGRIIPLISLAGDKFFTPPDDPSHFSSWNTPRLHKDLMPDSVKLLWAGDVRPGEIRRYSLLRRRVPAGISPLSEWQVDLDHTRWPGKITYLPSDHQMLRSGAGEFTALTVAGDFKRATYSAMFSGGSCETMTFLPEFEPAVREDYPETVVFRQSFRHELLRHGERKIVIWKHLPRLRISCKIDRIEDAAPAVFFVKIPMGCTDELPRISAAGEFFTPYSEQLPTSCRDFFVTDDVIFYPQGGLAAGMPDCTLFSLGAPRLFDRLTSAPAGCNDIYSMVFNNFWDTNFAGNQFGLMEFRYDVFAAASVQGEQLARRMAQSFAAGLVPIVQCRNQTGEDEK